MQSKKSKMMGKQRDRGWHTLFDPNDDGQTQVFLVSGFNPMEPTGFLVNYDKTSNVFLSVGPVKPLTYEQNLVGII